MWFDSTLELFSCRAVCSAIIQVLLYWRESSHFFVTLPRVVSHVQRPSIFPHFTHSLRTVSLLTFIWGGGIKACQQKQSQEELRVVLGRENVARFQCRWGKSFQLHFLSRKAFQAFTNTAEGGSDSWKGKFRYKILLEHYEHATVVIGRRKSSTASSKPSRPPSELKVFVFPEWGVTECRICFSAINQVIVADDAMEKVA